MDAKFDVVLSGNGAESDVVFKVGVAGMTISVYPEHPECITGVDLVADHGTFNTFAENGDFHISWTNEKVALRVAKSGDGEGGALEVELSLTSAARASLREALTKWKAAFTE